MTAAHSVDKGLLKRSDSIQPNRPNSVDKASSRSAGDTTPSRRGSKSTTRQSRSWASLTTTSMSQSPSRRHSDNTSFGDLSARSTRNASSLPHQDDNLITYRKGATRLAKPCKVLPPPPMYKEEVRGKRHGYVAAIATEIELGQPALDKDVYDPDRLEIRNEPSYAAGKTSREIAEDVQKVVLQRCKLTQNVSAIPKKTWTDPILHQNPDVTYSGQRQPNPPGMEDAAGLMTDRMTVLQTHWIGIPRRTHNSEHAPQDLTDPVLHRHGRAELFVDAVCAKKQIAKQDAAERGGRFLSHSSRPVALTDGELRHARAGKFAHDMSGMLTTNIAGREDLVPGGHAPYLSCDRPASADYQTMNSKRLLRSFERGLQPVETKKTSSSLEFLESMGHLDDKEDPLTLPPTRTHLLGDSARGGSSVRGRAALRQAAGDNHTPPQVDCGGRIPSSTRRRSQSLRSIGSAASARSLASDRRGSSGTSDNPAWR